MSHDRPYHRAGSSAAPAISTPFWMSTRWVIVAYLVFGALAVSPLMWVAIPPLIDFPNHLARMAVILADHDPTAVITRNYIVHWRIVPNLAMDLTVPLLAQIVPIEVAGRIFIGAIIVMLLGGTAVLHRVLHGRFGLWPLCSVLFIYGGLLADGVVNYLFGLGVALLSFSAWISTALWQKSLRICIFAVAVVIIFLLHLFAFGVFTLLVVSYEMGLCLAERPFTTRKLISRSIGFLQFIPAALLWFLFPIGYKSSFLPAQPADLYQRLVGIWLSVVSFNGPPERLDYLIFLFVVAFLIFGFATRSLVLAPSMRAPIVALVIMAILMPDHVSGAWAVILRLPVALLFILVAATRLDAARAGWPLTTFAVIGCLLFGLRIGAVTLAWRVIDHQFTEYRQAIRKLPKGSRMMTVQSAWPMEAHKIDGVFEALQVRSRAAFWHLDTLAVLDRGMFVPHLFTTATPVSVSPGNPKMNEERWHPVKPEELLAWTHPINGAEESRYCCYDWPKGYSFLTWVDFGHPPERLPPFLELWSSGSYFHIYRVLHSVIGQ